MQGKGLTDRLLRNWFRCRRRAWLDKYGNAERRLWTAHRTIQLNDQQQGFTYLIESKPKRGVKACEEGTAGVVGIRLKGTLNSGQVIEAHPPLLQRIEGESRWGNFAYRPVLWKQGKRLTREHRLGLSLVGLLLEPFQKAEVPEGLIISRANRGIKKEKITLNNGLEKQLSDSLEKLAFDLNRKEPPPLTADRRKCSLCSWRSLCGEEAGISGHLSEVSGIGARRLQILEELDIHNLEDLAAADLIFLKEKLDYFGTQHGEAAQQLIKQAMVQRDGCAERLDQKPALPELRSAPGVLIYDIESDPDAKDDFLHGFVNLPRRKCGEWNIESAKYHPLLILAENGEDTAWERLKWKLDYYSDWPILHYGETEALSLSRIAQRQGASQDELKALHNRLIDIHARVRKHWLLPVNSYGLKAVAGWIGFKWSQFEVDGAKALLWWRQWRGGRGTSRGNSNSLRRIYKYNKDDCLATWAVAKWLMDNS